MTERIYLKNNIYNEHGFDRLCYIIAWWATVFPKRKLFLQHVYHYSSRPTFWSRLRRPTKKTALNYETVHEKQQTEPWGNSCKAAIPPPHKNYNCYWKQINCGQIYLSLRRSDLRNSWLPPKNKCNSKYCNRNPFTSICTNTSAFRQTTHSVVTCFKGLVKRNHKHWSCCASPQLSGRDLCFFIKHK